MNYSNTWQKIPVPLVIVLLSGYSDFVIGWLLGYKEIYRYHSHGAAISLWLLMGLCQTLMYIYWGIIFVKGPGKVSQLQQYDIYNTGDESLTPPPPYFFCDEYGYPFWCTNCRTIKGARVSHMSALNRCVPRADHYCMWIGTVIGRNNYRPFFKFASLLFGFVFIMLIYLAVYTRSNIERGLDNNFIVLYILTGFWSIMIFALVASHVYYLKSNMTTIDDLAIKRMMRAKRSNKNDEGQSVEGRRFINVDRGDYRLVVQCSAGDKFFNFGFKKNWINVMVYDSCTFFGDEKYYSTGAFIMSFMIALIPGIEFFLSRELGTDEVSFSPGFLDYIDDKIAKRRCFLPLYNTNAAVRARPAEGLPGDIQEPQITQPGNLPPVPSNSSASSK